MDEQTEYINSIKQRSTPDLLGLRKANEILLGMEDNRSSGWSADKVNFYRNRVRLIKEELTQRGEVAEAQP